MEAISGGFLKYFNQKSLNTRWATIDLARAGRKQSTLNDVNQCAVPILCICGNL